MLTDSIQTRVVTFNTAKPFTIPIKTLCLKDFNVSVHKSAKLRNDAQLRIATVTRFSWYTLLQTQLFSNVVA